MEVGTAITLPHDQPLWTSVATFVEADVARGPQGGDPTAPAAAPATDRENPTDALGPGTRAHRTLALTADSLRAYSRRGNFHSDADAAAAIGYPGLVAQGMQVAGPAYGLLLDAWGEALLTDGTLDLKFVGIVTDDETVDATVAIADRTASLAVAELDQRPHRGRRLGHGAQRARRTMSPLTLHPWNDAFTWTDHTGPFRRITAEQARAFDEQGFFVLEDAVDAETLAALDAAIEPFDAEVIEFLRTQPDGRFHIAGVDTVSIAIHIGARSPVLRDFCCSELFADLCHDLIGPDARLYWDQAVYKRPHGAEPVLWHQDNGYTYVEPQSYLTCWVAVTDATLENGCVEVLPGVHRLGTRRAQEHADRVPVRGEPGRRGRGPGEGREHRGVHVAHPARHRSQPDRRDPQGVHPPVRARRRSDALGRSRRRPAARARPTERSRAASSPSSSAASDPWRRRD